MISLQVVRPATSLNVIRSFLSGITPKEASYRRLRQYLFACRRRPDIKMCLGDYVC